MLMLGLVAGVAARKASWNARIYEQIVAAACGLNLRIGSVEYRTPTSIRFRDVTVLDGRAETPLFHAPEVEWSFSASETDEADLLSIPQAEVRFEAFTPEESARKTQELLFELLTRYRKTPERPIQVVLDQVHLRLNGNRPLPNSVRSVQGKCSRTTESVQFEWTFQIPQVSETETQRFTIEDRQTPQGREFVFHFSNIQTGSKDYPQVIPCELAGAFCSFFHLFSKGSHFSGEITAEYRVFEPRNPWMIHLTGLFLQNLDVSQYATEYSSFPFSGSADVQLYRATFDKGTMTAAEGWLHTRKGSIDRTLFRRLVDRFGLTVHPLEILESPATAIPFDQCVVFFRLAQDGVTFWKDSDNHLFMVSPAMQVSLPNTKSSVPYLTLLATFAPDNVPVVPLTPGTQRIIGVLSAEQPTRQKVFR